MLVFSDALCSSMLSSLGISLLFVRWTCRLTCTLYVITFRQRLEHHRWNWSVWQGWKWLGMLGLTLYYYIIWPLVYWRLIPFQANFSFLLFSIGIWFLFQLNAGPRLSQKNPPSLRFQVDQQLYLVRFDEALFLFLGHEIVISAGSSRIKNVALSSIRIYINTFNFAEEL